MKRWIILLLLVALVIVGVVSAETIATTNGVVSVTIEEVVTIPNQTANDAVTGITTVGDGRLFIAKQSGRIHIWTGSELLPTPFLDLSTEVENCNECGLLGVAFHPDYQSNGYFYVNYSEDNSVDTIIERFQVSAEDPNIATKTGRQVVLEVDQPAANHNGGALHFGPDGYLYIGMGDGGDRGDPLDNAQDGAELLGKMLRIDVTGITTYTIPVDNPFIGNATVRDEVWALGLRNPFRFSFDSSTGAMWIGDVGQRKFEEVDYQPVGVGGQNYGWDCYEANALYPVDGTDPGDHSADCPTDPNVFTFPVYNYPHSGGAITGCSITGGVVYRGGDYPSLQGHYFFADYCTGDLWTLSGDPTNPTFNTTTAGSPSNPSTFGTDHRDELYVGYSNGAVYRITDGTPLAVGLSNVQITDISPALFAALTLLGIATWRIVTRTKKG